jgi:nicotinamide mononucleotide transporter
VEPRWASPKVRIGLIAAMLAGTAVLTPLFTLLGSYPPVWADAWIFMGSLLATYGMAKGWVEFWLIWVAVDVVGVPLLFAAGYYASAVMYIFYGGFTLAGFFVWWRIRSRQGSGASAADTAVPDRSVTR